MASRGQGSTRPSRQPTPKNWTEKQQPDKGERTEPGETRGGTGVGFAAGARMSSGPEPRVNSAAENAFENIQHPRLIK